MKKVHFLVFIIFILIFSSCTTCVPWGEKADNAFKSMKEIYLNDSLIFIDCQREMNQILEKIDISYTSTEYYTWHIDSVNNIKNLEERTVISAFFLLNNIEAGNIESKDMIFFYPKNLLEYSNENESCSYFSYEIVFIKSNEIPWTNSLNLKWYKLAENWYLRTSISSL